MDAYAWSLLVAAFLVSLKAGFLFAFAVIVMPGIERLHDRDYLRGFAAIDGVIQDGQPLFLLVWLGSSVALIATAVLAVLYRGGVDQTLAMACTAANLLLVQLPTVTINIPLNNRVQSLDFEELDDAEARQQREAFQPQWNRWNRIRSVVSFLVVAALLVLLWRL